MWCELCQARPADVRLQGGNGHPQWLCEPCFRAHFRRQQGTARPDVARFFVLLARLRRRPPTLELPRLPAETACPGCGLRYEEFAARGLVGCAACYAAFAEAIFPALEALRSHGRP